MVKKQSLYHKYVDFHGIRSRNSFSLLKEAFVLKIPILKS